MFLKTVKFHFISVLVIKIVLYEGTLKLIIICLTLLTMTNPNQMREVLLFVCSKMADYWTQGNPTTRLNMFLLPIS